MAVSCLSSVFVLLCLGQLSQSQFLPHDAECTKVCQEGEGNLYTVDSICRTRYTKCLKDYYVNNFQDEGIEMYNKIVRRLFTIPEPCKNVEQGTEIEGTLCRVECGLKEKQLQSVPLEVCDPGFTCCKENPGQQICGRFYDDIYQLPRLKGSGPKCMYNCMLNHTGMLGDNGLINVENIKNLKTHQTSLLQAVAEECKHHKHLSENQCETVGLFMECTTKELIRRHENGFSMAYAIVNTYSSS